MQFSVTLETDPGSGYRMKTNNTNKNPNRKETNLDNVDQLCTKLHDSKDHESAQGMPTCTLEHTEAVRRYYAAFPALKKGQESPLQYYLPPPAWCRKPTHSAMQSDFTLSKDWNKKKLPTNKERRSSYHGQRKNKKRNNSHSKSFENKEILPEWVTHEGVWDMDSQDPVKEFIRAIALDEGYGTCENTVTDELHQMSFGKMRIKDNIVPDWEESLDLDAEWVISDDLKPKVLTPMEEELYAKFEAKFDRSIEALWSKDQNTPDDEYQDLPIDFQDLLSSPSDHMFVDPSAEKCSLISLTESIWSNDGFPIIESPTRLAEVLHDRFKPLNLIDTPMAKPQKVDSFALYSDEINDVSTVAMTKRSLTAINHSRERSGFVEVPPRRQKTECVEIIKEVKVEEPRRSASREREDLLTSSRTHFRPIKRESADVVRYKDGDAFDIRGDLDEVEFNRSASGGHYLTSTLERYLEYRGDRGINYNRLKLTAAQRCPDLEDPGFVLRFPLRQRDIAIQTEEIVVWNSCKCGRGAKKMRPAMESIWSESGGCEGCETVPVSPTAPLPPEELSREWEELLADISAAHAEYSRSAAEAVEEVVARADRKRRHSAALRTPQCSHPHARFLQCCALLDRPLTR